MKEPIYKVIENHVRNLINSDELKQGDLIPSEKQLSEEFNVTRMTVRSALNNLVKEGYITRQRGVGSIVITNRIYDNISAVSGFTKEMNSKGYEVSNILLGLRVVQSDQQLSDKLKINIGDNVWEVKRVRLADNVRVSYMITYMPVKLFPNLNENHCKNSLYSFVEDICGYNIAVSEREVQAIISNNEIMESLQLEEVEPILYISQVCRLQNGEIFEYSHTYHHGYTLTLKAVSKK